MNKNTLLLIVCIIIASFLRFIGLGNNPPSLTWDEVAIGYNAYSIGIDGRDEYGNFLPFQYFESFGDFKPPVAVYLDVLPVKIFGLTPFAVRFPSALLGVATVIMTYFLTKRIFYTSKRKEVYAIISALILALSPWHIMLSRAMFEANIATFFIVSGIWAYLASTQEKKYLLPVSALLFVLSLYTFNSARIAVPLLVVILSIRFYKFLLQNKIVAVSSLFVGLILIAPLVPFLLSDKASIRFQEVNIFSDPTPVIQSNQQILNDNNAFWSSIINNRRIFYGLSFTEHFFDHLKPSFLFIRGDINPKFSIQDVGQLYLWDLPFIIIGILFLFRKKEGEWWFIPLWIFIGILPAATAKETPHALRIESTLPAFQILVGYGVITAYFLFNKLQSPILFKKAIIVGVLGLLVLNIFYFQYQYWKYYPQRYSMDWQYGYPESIKYVGSVKDKYNKIYITEALGRGYIYTLFYLKTPPAEFRNTVKLRKDKFGLIDVEGFNNIIFSRTVESEPRDSKALYINRSDRVPAGVKILRTFYLLDGSPRLTAYVY